VDHILQGLQPLVVSLGLISQYGGISGKFADHAGQVVDLANPILVIMAVRVLQIGIGLQRNIDEVPLPGLRVSFPPIVRLG
jgi:hypothetical protein